MQNRLKKIREILQANDIDGLLISNPANITYLTNFTFLSPTEREAYVFVTKKQQYIISSFLYKEELRRSAPDFIFLDVSKDNGTPFWKYISTLAEKDHLQRVGFEEHNLTVAEYAILNKQKLDLIPLAIDGIRTRKDTTEIEAIRQACHVSDKAFVTTVKHIKPGMTEKEIALFLDTTMRKMGAEPSFATIVAFGKNAAVPHHQTDTTALQKNDTILMDFGAKIQNYCSDMSRTIFIGKPTDEQKKVYETVKNAQQKALDYLFSQKTPVSAADTDKIARDSIIQEGFPSIPHSLGHSIGIEVHDGFGLSPFSKTQLLPGMVFSVEPGIYLSQNVGVRIEDIVALTDNGPEILTKSPRELIIV